jgi:hypothetical protein
MGAYTVEITWTVSVLTLFPLTYIALMPNLIRAPQNAANRSEEADPSLAEEREKKREKARESLRTQLYLICVGLSSYPFLSSMFSVYGPRQIGNGPGAAINDTDWAIIQNICFGGPILISVEETTAMNACLTISWIVVFGLTIAKLLVDIANGSNPDLAFLHKPLKQLARPLSKSLSKIPWASWPLLVAIMAITQFWTYLRLHQAQKHVAETSDNSFLDNQWSFGQIVAITVFTPVIVDCLYWIRDDESEDGPSNA